MNSGETWRIAMVERSDMTKCCIVISPAFAMDGCYRGQLEYMVADGCELTMVSDLGAEEHASIRGRGIRSHVVPMVRNPSPLRDFLSLVRLWWFFVQHRFHVIQVSTPKASLLGALAARLSGQKNVVYLVRGRPYEHVEGWRRSFYSFLDSTTCRLSEVVVPNSMSLKKVMIGERICQPEKIRTVGFGSSIGVDIDRFDRKLGPDVEAADLKRSLGIDPDHTIALFVGWLRREKGLEELVAAFREVAQKHPDLHLMLLGNPYEGDPVSEETTALIRIHDRIHRVPWRHDPVPVFQAADFLVLPSWREGFPRVILEGAANSLPAIVSDHPGCRESVLEGETGLVVPVRNVACLSAALDTLTRDPELRRRMGQAAREMVSRRYRQEDVWRGHWAVLLEVAHGRHS